MIGLTLDNVTPGRADGDRPREISRLFLERANLLAHLFV